MAFTVKTAWKITWLLPPISIITVYTVIVRFRLAFGYWPNSDNADPTNIGMPNHELFAHIAFTLTTFSPLFVLALLLISLLKKNAIISKKEIGKCFCIYLVSFIGSLSMISIDPGKALIWFFGSVRNFGY